MAIQFQEQDSKWRILLDGEEVLTIPVPKGCHDSFELISGNAFYWRRKTDAPVTQMKLTLQADYKPRYFQIPAVN